MKRLTVLVVLVLAVCVVLAPGRALAGSRSAALIRAVHAQHMSSVRGLLTPRLAAGPYAIDGTVEDFDGSALQYYAVDWGWYDPDVPSWSVPASVYHAGGETTADSDGTFSFSGVSAHPGHDDLITYDQAYPAGDPPSLEYIDSSGLDFSTVGNYTLRPGHVNVTVTNAPAGKPVDVWLGDPATGITESSVTLADGAGLADAVAPDFDSGTASIANDDGTVPAECDWVSPSDTPVAVSAGTLAAGSVAFDWSKAVHGRFAGSTYRRSGSPGSTVNFKVWNMPPGEQLSFAGFSFSPDDWGTLSYKPVVTSSSAATTYTVSLKIPLRATVGEIYCIDAYRTDDPYSPLDLYDYYLVCTLAPTHGTVRPGGAVRLRGHIDGDTATLFVRHRAAAQPGTLWPHGWTKVENLAVSTSGKFFTPTLHPSRTSWYVVRYAGGDFEAFTPVVKVNVR
jgi:hypothetical protein